MKKSDYFCAIIIGAILFGSILLFREAFYETPMWTFLSLVYVAIISLCSILGVFNMLVDRPRKNWTYAGMIAVVNIIGLVIFF